MKNLLTLHEAVCVALINAPDRTATFEEIADFIEKRGLFPERKGGVTLAQQVMLRTTQSSGRYHHLFELTSPQTIRMRNL